MLNGSRHWRIRQEEEQRSAIHVLLSETAVKITRLVKRHLVFLAVRTIEEARTNFKWTCWVHK